MILRLIIGLFPSSLNESKFISLSEELAEHGTSEFVLGKEGPYPHVTLFKLSLADNKLGELVRVIHRISLVHNIPRLGVIDAHSERGGYVGLRLSHEPELREVHACIVNQTSGLRHRNADRMWSGKRLEGMNELERSFLTSYGYPFVFEQYNPHLTAICYKEQATAKHVAARLNEHCKFPDVSPAGIAIFREGPFGSAVEELEAFAFCGTANAHQTPATATS